MTDHTQPASAPTTTILPPMTRDSEEEISSTDLLIRGITTILWLLWPKAKNPHSHSKRYLQRLSRLSLLFVSAIEPADVAAITAVVDRDGVHVEAVQASMEPIEGRLAVVKNHMENKPWNIKKLPKPETLKAELLEDPLRFCFTRGVAAITPDAHGATLQRLLTDMYERAPTRPPDDQSRDPLRRYIYCFCHKKILQRLQSRLLGNKGSFLDLFLEGKRHGPLTRGDFQQRQKQQVQLTGNPRTTEYWLYYTLAGRYKNENFGPAPTKGQPYRLNLEEDQLWRVWEYFTKCLENLNLGLIWLDKNTRGNLDKQHKNAETVLTQVAMLIETLYDFVHSSPTFWNLVVEMSDVLQGRMGAETAEESGTSWSSPSAISSNHSSSSRKGVSPPHSDSQSWAQGDAEQHEMVPDVSHETNDESAAYSDGEDEEAGEKDKKVEGVGQLSGIALKVRTWLRSVTQWHGAICDLSQGHLALGILNRQLSIHVDVAPKPVQPKRQASLKAIVESLDGPGDANDRLECIVSRARDVYKGRPPAENTAAHALVNASLDNEASLERWEHLFAGSSVHCEARLACTMHETQIQRAPIAVSKRCCYCCAILLHKLGIDKEDISYHGKIYSWPPPPGLDPKIKDHILKKLKGRLDHGLKEYAAGRRETDSSPGSEEGSGTQGEGNARRPIMLEMRDIAAEDLSGSEE